MTEPKNPFLERENKQKQDHQANLAQERPRGYQHSATKVGMSSLDQRTKGMSGEELREFLLGKD
ncbi:MAG TPA: hypothetical protein VF209_01715 [Patescibacteria group bacterium]